MGQRLEPGDAPSLAVRLLGPFEMQQNGVPAARLLSRKGQWLLALLLLRRGHEVDRAWLAGTLWPESPMEVARYNLRRELTGLRRALGEDADRLGSPTPRTLHLNPLGAAVDVLAFDDALARGARDRSAAAAWNGGAPPRPHRGRPTEAGGSDRARVALEEAITHYHGPLLEGCGEHWVIAEREAREEAYLAALEALTTLAITRGDRAEALRRLRLIVAADPLRESAQRRLMEALAVTGEYAAAIDVYRNLCRNLHRELNAGPSPETISLYHQLRAAARPRPVSGARALGTEGEKGRRGDGERRQQHDRPLPNSPSSRRPFSPSVPIQTPERRLVPRSLPRPLTKLIGRDEDVQAVLVELAAARLVTLTGPGGVGKTRLALQVAEQWTEERSERVAFVELASLADPALVPQALASVLGVREVRSLDALVKALRALPCEQDLMLVLDNCEHLLAPCGQLAERLLEGCPELRILATSRQSLGLRGEVAWRVPSLPTPAPSMWADSQHDWPHRKVAPILRLRHPTPAERTSALLGYPALQLFVERAHQARPCFEVTPQNLRAAAQICHRLDGIPLAIELAAARVKAMPVAQIAARLDNCFKLLTGSGGSHATLPRHQTLRAATDWSYHLLTPPEQALLRRLAAFSGGWTLEAAEAVCSDFGFGILDFGSRTERPSNQDTGSRKDTESPSAIQNPKSKIQNEDLLDLLISLVDKSLVGYEERNGGARYRLLDSVRQYGHERLIESGESEAVRTRHLEHFLQLATTARSHFAGGKATAWMDRLEQEHDNLRAALEWAFEPRATPDRLPELGVRLAMALATFWDTRAHSLDGSRWLERAREQGAGLPPAVRGAAGVAAGAMAFRQRDYPRAKVLLEEALSLKRLAGDTIGVADTLARLGSVARFQGDFPTARALFEDSLATWRAYGDRSGIAAALNRLAHFTWQQGNDEEARSLSEETLATYREIGQRNGIVWSLHCLGSVAHGRGDYRGAQSLYQESYEIARQAGNRWQIAWSLTMLGYVAQEQAALETAQAMLEESLDLWGGVGDAFGLAWSLHGLGRVAAVAQDLPTARAYLAESLGLRHQIGHKEGIAYSLRDLARVALAAGRTEQAARLYGAVEALLETIGAPPILPLERPTHDHQLAALRAALGEPARTAAWAEGRALPLEQAISLALAQP